MGWWDGARAFLESVISILAIVNPIGNLPILASLSEGYTRQERRRMFRIAGVASLGIVCAMTVLGRYILRYVFHIEIAEFMFGGGVMLMALGIRNIIRGGEVGRVRTSDVRQREAEQVSLAVSPIASPLLVGPGTIVTVMVLAGKYGIVYGLAACCAAFAVVILVLHYSDTLLHAMGPVGSRVVGRVMQIFIVAIGAHFVFLSLKEMFPALGK